MYSRVFYTHFFHFSETALSSIFIYNNLLFSLNFTKVEKTLGVHHLKKLDANTLFFVFTAFATFLCKESHPSCVYYANNALPATLTTRKPSRCYTSN